jgi:hypothetical protein
MKIENYRLLLRKKIRIVGKDSDRRNIPWTRIHKR